MSRDFPLTGLAQLEQVLTALPGNLHKNAHRAGLVAAQKPIRDDARQRARKRTRKMAKSIKSGSPRARENGTITATISLKGDHAFLGYFWEFGVEPHFIQGGDSGLSPRLTTRMGKNGGVEEDGENARGQRVLKIGNQYVTGAVRHPGLAADPFMRPALDTKADEAVRAYAKRLADYVEGRTGFSMAPVEEDD